MTHRKPLVAASWTATSFVLLALASSPVACAAIWGFDDGTTTAVGGGGATTTTSGSGAAGGAGASGGSTGGSSAGGGVALGCQDESDPPVPTGEAQLVTRPFDGVHVVHRTASVPRPLSYQVVRIDPGAPGLRFLVTPPNGAADLETTKRTASAFLQAEGAVLAINAHFFEPWPAPDPDPGFADLVGLAASDGDAYSPFSTEAQVGLNFDSEGVPAIVRQAAGDATGLAPEPAVTLFNAVGAREQIVTAGANTASSTTTEPRTAIGLTASGEVVAIVVDGRNTGVSEGMTLAELADLLIGGFGVVDAINLDGGGSTTLAVADPRVHAINAPSGDAGAERPVGSHLGLFAAPCRGTGSPTGDLLAHEGFDYPHRPWGTTSNGHPDGGGLEHAIGGSGWASGWLDDRTLEMLNGIAVFPADAGQSGDARTAPLGFTDGLGNGLLTVGGQARTSFGPFCSSRRYFDLSLPGSELLRPDGLLGADGSTLWLSFLAQSYGALGDIRYAYLELGGQLRFGLVAPANGYWGMEDVASGQSWASTIATDAAVFFVVELEFAAGDEHVSVWLDPPLDAEPAGNPTLSAAVGDLGFGSIDLASRYSTDFDEIRLGTTFAAVTPHSP